MRIEDQVVSLELAKKMKELGFRQESLFYWNRLNGIRDDSIIDVSLNKIRGDYGDVIASAYTVAELGTMLPHFFTGEDGKNAILKIYKGSKTWGIYYSGLEDHIIKVEMVVALTEADARAKTLIYLKENNLIK